MGLAFVPKAVLVRRVTGEHKLLKCCSLYLPRNVSVVHCTFLHFVTNAYAMLTLFWATLCVLTHLILKTILILKMTILLVLQIVLLWYQGRELGHRTYLRTPESGQPWWFVPNGGPREQSSFRKHLSHSLSGIRGKPSFNWVVTVPNTKLPNEENWESS